ncbi:MAG: hypothetical protein AAFU80_11375 [Pseudomonadota bacterium]
MAASLLIFAKIYGWIGLAAAVPFLAFGLDRIDDSAVGSWVFRTLLIPGIVLLWPLVLWRWFQLETGRGDAQARHRPPIAPQLALALLLALLIPVAILSALVLRQDGPIERPSVLLEAPA